MIETQRLTVRRFTPDDWKDLHEYLSDPMVVFYEPYDVLTREECESEAMRRSSDRAFWAVCLKENNKLIGNIYLSMREFNTWELGYVFNRSYQGKGYAFESVSAVVNYAILHCAAHRITAMCNPDNKKSWKLLERLKMRREGHLVQNVYFKRDGNNHPIWQDTYEYALSSSEWEPLSD